MRETFRRPLRSGYAGTTEFPADGIGARDPLAVNQGKPKQVSDSEHERVRSGP
jgi:hypothetical protein